tara:strand:- start:713 stop:1432 length:720 start_codon:yes stop_codon:yes gene_type:complete
MTLDEIAYNILNLVRGGRSNTGEHISISQIKFNIKYYRAMFIRRDFAKNGNITRHLEQDLKCIEFEKVDASKCCSLPINCDVYRSKLKIPKTVRLSFKDAITHVSDVSGLETIPIVDAITVQWLPYDKFTKRAKRAYMIEDYLYIYNANGMQFGNVRGVFEDPEDLSAYDCDGSACYDAHLAFPVPMDMVQMITQGIASTELKLLAGTFSDTANDNAQDLPAPSRSSSRGRDRREDTRR